MCLHSFYVLLWAVISEMYTICLFILFFKLSLMIYVSLIKHFPSPVAQQITLLYAYDFLLIVSVSSETPSGICTLDGANASEMEKKNEHRHSTEIQKQQKVPEKRNGV